MTAIEFPIGIFFEMAQKRSIFYYKTLIWFSSDCQMKDVAKRESCYFSKVFLQCTEGAY